MLAITELGLGSALHAARVPLRGQLLSLNQIFILMRASKEGGFEASRFLPASISNAAAVLKCLSPAGNKLTPMLAIAMQGWLFSFGTACFGHSQLGRISGGILSSLWAFIQPVLLYGVIFGTGNLTGSFNEMALLFPGSDAILLYCIAGLICIKTLLVIAMGMKLPATWFERVFLKLTCTQSEKKRSSPAQGALKQLLKPVFLCSVGLSALLLFFAEGNYASLLWHLLRPLAIGFLLFFGMRRLPLDQILSWLTNKQKGRFGETLAIALDRIRSYSNTSRVSPSDKTP